MVPYPAFVRNGINHKELAVSPPLAIVEFNHLCWLISKSTVGQKASTHPKKVGQHHPSLG
jgi:hypothetical protein